MPHPFPRPLDEPAALEALDGLVDAFSRTDTSAYFGQLAPEATFLFHTEPAVVPDRAAYRALWDSWVASGWRVVACKSSDRQVQLLGSVALDPLPDVGRQRDVVELRADLLLRRDLLGDVDGVDEHAARGSVGLDHRMVDDVGVELHLTRAGFLDHPDRHRLQLERSPVAMNLLWSWCTHSTPSSLGESVNKTDPRSASG